MIRVMVAEDEPPILRQIGKLISMMDIDFEVVAMVQNGKEAREALEEAKVDVLFTDIQMNGGNGTELLNFISGCYPQIQTVVLSGYDKFEYVKSAYKCGVTDYLLKPVNRAELANVLDILKNHYIQTHSLSKREKDTCPKLVYMIEEYINKNYRTYITSEMFAREFGFVPSYISKVFKRHRNITPMQYLTKVRLERACELLRKKTDIRVKEVAEEVGYDNIQYFSKVFKKEIGIWPTEYK